MVSLRSAFFETEAEYDYVEINGQRFSGNQNIDMMVQPGSTDAVFFSHGHEKLAIAIFYSDP